MLIRPAETNPMSPDIFQMSPAILLMEPKLEVHDEVEGSEIFLGPNVKSGRILLGRSWPPLVKVEEWVNFWELGSSNAARRVREYRPGGTSPFLRDFGPASETPLRCHRPIPFSIV